ncbi:MAG: hypothetical protein QM820_41375 [Minicystis sp.]
MTSGRRRPGPGEITRLALVAIFFLAAPTAGDIGSCNQTAVDLDAAKFFDAKQTVDCKRCDACGLTSGACQLACGPAQPAAFPKGCYPVVHDGEVCLDALQAASCADYQSYMADQGATIPTECDFCPVLPADTGAAGSAP